MTVRCIQEQVSIQARDFCSSPPVDQTYCLAGCMLQKPSFRCLRMFWEEKGGGRGGWSGSLVIGGMRKTLDLERCLCIALVTFLSVLFWKCSQPSSCWRAVSPGRVVAMKTEILELNLHRAGMILYSVYTRCCSHPVLTACVGNFIWGLKCPKYWKADYIVVLCLYGTQKITFHPRQ